VIFDNPQSRKILISYWISSYIDVLGWHRFYHEDLLNKETT
tara:strand:- start:429 stop:551 length:123 start_codon:yes stop_codon:yes gene_type:complete